MNTKALWLAKQKRLRELANNRRIRPAHDDERIDDGFDSLYIAIGEAINKARAEANVTQAELAAVLGMQRTSIANIEAGLQRLPIHRLYALAILLDVPVKSLLPDDLGE